MRKIQLLDSTVGKLDLLKVIFNVDSYDEVIIRLIEFYKNNK